MLDNIGLPYSGINIALSDSATVGPMDGEILISLEREAHAHRGVWSRSCDASCRARFPQLQFFFQPADIVDQVLNFGQPAPIDIRVSGPRPGRSLRARIASSRARMAARARRRRRACLPGAGCAGAHGRRRSRAGDADRASTQQEAANNVLVATNSSAQTAPNFWVDPRNNVSYPLVVQMPTYRIDSTHDLGTMPVTAGAARKARASC